MARHTRAERATNYRETSRGDGHPRFCNSPDQKGDMNSV